MHQKNKKPFRPFIFSALTAGTILIVMILAPLVRTAYSAGQNPFAVIKEKMQVLNQILVYVNELYFEPVDMEKLMNGALTGIMKELDPHSVYIPAKELEEIDEQFRGNFQGIGIEFDILHGYITVISPVADSPSEKVGLQPGDQVIAIDGEDAYNITKKQVFERLRGPKGSPVTVTIRRPSEKKPFDVTIVRDNIPIYSVRASVMLDDSTGYIWLTRFSATTIKEMRAAMEKLRAQNMKRLIFDLRNNSGGYLDQAAAVADLFIAAHDTLVYTKGKRKDVEQAFVSDARTGEDDFPLIVLVNRGSASASEIVAGAVQDLDRGLILGETTFGKGLVQRQIQLRDGSAIRVTIARYFTPSGRLIQRPFNNGDDLSYYKELYEKDREAKLDSLKATLPKYHTRSGRTVYGGGGITPDVYIPWENNTLEATRKLLWHSKRPIFNWASIYAARLRESEPDFETFRSDWTLLEEEFQEFLTYLKEEEIHFDSEAIEKDRDKIIVNIKAEIAGALWSRNEAVGIRLEQDNQVLEAQNHFPEAGAFLARQKSMP
ncbi:MAG: S41 family peptidase [Fidelibacterota bacterium]